MKKSDLFTGIPHRVIDSPAYAALRGNSVKLLLIIARQYNGSNNGLLQATYSYCGKRGFNSEHTLRDAISQLIAHGLIVKTRGHGINENGKNTCARFAITWLKPCTAANRKGVFFDGYMLNAWEKWVPKKIQGGKNCSSSNADIAVPSVEVLQKVQNTDP